MSRCKLPSFDFIHRKVFVLKEGNYVVLNAIVIDNLAEAPRHLVVGPAALLNEDCVRHVETPGPRLMVVGLFIDKDDEVVTEPINLLARRLEWTRGLRLPDACDLDIQIEARNVDAASGVALSERIL